MPALRGSSQSLERGLAILSAFKPATPELGISELARSLGLSRSTSHRYVSTLARLGYLEQNPETRKYRLGPRVLDLGFSAINSMELRQIAAAHLQKLADETGHTVNMAILDGTDIVYIERCRSSQQGQREIDLDLHVGSRLPAYCTSMGKVLLACLPDGAAGRPRRRWSSRARAEHDDERKALAAELDAGRATGMAVNNEELAYGLRSIAVPVSGRAGRRVAAINLAVHRSAASIGDLVDRLSPKMRRAAAGISALLGYRPT